MGIRDCPYWLARTAIRAVPWQHASQVPVRCGVVHTVDAAVQLDEAAGKPYLPVLGRGVGVEPPRPSEIPMDVLGALI